MFAGRVVEVGAEVTRFAVGDDVFGAVDGGAYAELVAVDEDSPMAKMPDNLTYEEAASLGYGGGTALYFLTQLAVVKPGEHVCIVGATGGVGRAAIQIAKHLGATVTAVSSARNHALAKRLGADHVVDYQTEDFTLRGDAYDVVFDLSEGTDWAHSKPVLSEAGRFMTVYLSITIVLQMLWTSMFGAKKALFAIAMPNQADMEALAELAGCGALKPVVAEVFPFDDIRRAHAAAERPPAGDLVVRIAEPESLRAVG
jgi:NADPH:quinone reductase-like Zn-dependent oxidoreductase